MANRRLTDEQLVAANKLLALVRSKLKLLSGGRRTLLWALRRKVYKELTYDERGKPMPGGGPSCRFAWFATLVHTLSYFLLREERVREAGLSLSATVLRGCAAGKAAHGRAPASKR